MALKHGTRQRYGGGCRCGTCREAHRLYQRRYRERVVNGENRPAPVAAMPQPAGVTNRNEPGPVEQAVEAEVDGLMQPRPTLVAVAVAMARILDNSRVPTPKPPAAKVLVGVMDALHKGSVQQRGRLSVVKAMTEKGGA